MGEETKLKNWFRKRYAGWSDIHEPRHTMGQGFPDVSILERDDRTVERDIVLRPIEFKVGHRKDGILHVSKFEPAQVSWHYNFKKAGGIAYIGVGIRQGKDAWELFEVEPGDWMMEWRKGIPVEAISAWLRWAP